MISDSNPNLFEQEKGCGQHLREAREAAGLSVDEVAGKLRMPARVVHALEQEDWQRLGAPVFVRGQLRSYARLLQVDLEPLLRQATIAPIEPVKLVSHTHTPRARRILESTARKAMYVVITGVFAVPVWYATRSHLDGKAPSTVSLDSMPESAKSAAPGNPATQPAAAPREQPAPYIASMTPVPRAAQAPAAAVAPGGSLSLSFSGDSWVQILAPDGSAVEKALIRAGEQRTYSPGQVGRIVLGNASAVQVQQGGSIVDVKPFQRANVARFAVSSDGSVVPASE
ncbi:MULTISPECIES: helix-turn-helix domain-containing protein [Xanthomonas]|uniref:Cytoskeleton protein RodZ-like C-terminal domain-containing protein n=1 Tax=Xanthomonas phaseoli pv. dieffenbachiae TaxID=92828 RepID=A0A1V9HBX1_9XANT|nr:RodZ domain-containing protein [Xanthomonas phaseoli]MBO9768652.1 helix-turn-helix domain-containing protein [Xanthomonas phaseoli pv. dieffenbachiae]MBO9776494.1 helix-turn-helix domain-containing protein [Xanthomonas phaseoli pv. dieffenbachiae]MBO9781520.1 helix-turn-helix domain-containing protein [Xanthomonas phaseoli pv. dieffenbachiae]MBO9789892.1 helix-turn-helix domain-containing protein [Xanthomonas phaseoli pv. dieffenbachiae]MBO9794650.1 helix-turn-helix domain-containing protei